MGLAHDHRAEENRQTLAEQQEEWRASCSTRDSAMRVQRAAAAKDAAEAAAVRRRAELATLLVFGASRLQTLAEAILQARIQRKVINMVMAMADQMLFGSSLWSAEFA